MKTYAELVSDIQISLNENSENLQFWQKEDIDQAISLAIIQTLALSDTGWQVTEDIEATGISEHIVTDAVRILRVNKVGTADCSIRKMTPDAADKEFGCWRSCETDGDYDGTEKVVIDPQSPQNFYLLKPPPAGTKVSVTVIKEPTVDESLSIPTHLYPTVFDLSVARCYQREIGGHASRSEMFTRSGYNFLQDYTNNRG